MKKLLVLAGLLLAIGSVYAATTQFTETVPPQSPQGAVPVSNGYSWSLSSNSQGSVPPLTLPSGTSTYITGLTAATTGQIIFCTTCANGMSAKWAICMATGSTTTGQFVSVSTFTAATGVPIVCQ